MASFKHHQQLPDSFVKPSVPCMKHKRNILRLEKKIEVCKRLIKGYSKVAFMKEFTIGITMYNITKQQKKIKVLGVLICLHMLVLGSFQR